MHGLGVDEILATIDGAGAVSYYLADHLGSVVQVTDPSQQVTLIRQYDPWGVQTTGGSTSGYAFTGREWDTETGLYYYRARYYDAAAGRFTSADPIGLLGGQNLYTYARGNPVNSGDPSGLWSPGTHDAIINSGLSGVIPSWDIVTVQQASRDFDDRTQGSAQAPMHHMTPEGGSRAKAEQDYNNFLATTMQQAVALEKANMHDAALQKLAEGMHAVMDSTAPDHTDFEEWDGKLLSPKHYTHYLDDALPTDHEIEMTGKLVLDYYNRFKLLAGCGKD